MKKVDVKLVGVDGNIFSVLAAFDRAARRQGWTDAEVEEVTDAVMDANSYSQALSIILKRVNDPVNGPDDES